MRKIVDMAAVGTIDLTENDAFKRLVPIIQSGTCVLFLGAGVSIDSGAPSGRDAAKELSAAFFPDEPVSEDLGSTSEAIDAVYGRRDLNDRLVERLRSLTP